MNDPVADRLYRRVDSELPTGLQDFLGGGLVIEFALLPGALEQGLAVCIHDFQVGGRADLLDLAAMKQRQVRTGLVEGKLDAGGTGVDDGDAALHAAVSLRS